jgi:hypothetical protein
MAKPASRVLLTDFLKTRRARLSPAEFGFEEAGQRRRTEGLRRSEVAELAGVSTEWYTLFEMGRDRAMTQRIIDRVTRALRLNQAERDYIYDLVRAESPVQPHAGPHPAIEYGVGNVVAGSVIVYDPWLTRVRSNTIARELWSLNDDRDPNWFTRNAMWRLFKDPVTRGLNGAAWIDHARRNVGLFRRAFGRDPHNAQARAIVEELRSDPDFDALWSAHDVYSFEMFSNDGKVPTIIKHPTHGAIAVFTIMLELPGWPGAHIRYTAPADAYTTDVIRAIAPRKSG